MPIHTQAIGTNGGMATLSLKRQQAPARETEPFIGLGLGLRHEGHLGSSMGSDKPPPGSLPPKDFLPEPLHSQLIILRRAVSLPKVSCSSALQGEMSQQFQRGPCRSQTLFGSFNVDVRQQNSIHSGETWWGEGVPDIP